MKYTYIELVGYRRFMLNGINSFKMDLVSLLQLILGTNGSGKSSLLWELSPLPGDAKDFQKNGKKIIHIEHNARHYVLTNDFSGDRTHSFIVDGEELNLGGTVMVQQSLVKEHFGITPEIRKLLIGQDKFTSMGATKRKEWFLKLCPVNYDYAIKVYNQLKDRHRDITGSIKLDKRNLVIETERLLKDEELQSLTDQANELHILLNHLLEWRMPVEQDLDILEMRGMDIDQQLVSIGNSLLATLSNIKDKSITPADYEAIIATSNEEVQKCKAVLNHVGGEYETISKNIEIIKQAQERTIESLEEELNQKVEGCYNAVLSSLLKTRIDNPREAISQFSVIRNSLSEICTTIPINKDRIYSSAKMEEGRALLAQQTIQRGNIIEQLSALSASLSHMEKHKDSKDATCPKCTHTFSLVYDELRVADMSGKIDLLQTAKDNIVSAIANTQEYLESCTEYARLYRQYIQIQKSSPQLKDYWEYLADTDFIYTNPSEILITLEKFHQDLVLQVQIESDMKRIDEISATLKPLKTIGSSSLSDLTAALKEKEKILEEYSSAQLEHNARKSAATDQLNLLKSKDNLEAKLRSLIKENKLLAKDKVETNRRNILNSLIRQLQSELATSEHLLTQSKVQLGIVNALSNAISEKEREERALTILITELSPNDGLIAEGLLGFINNYMSEMNDLIEQVWTYPLEINSCEIVDGESIDLDYKFPFTVGQNTNPIADVSIGSTAQLEIFNLAYRITAMKYLGLADSALYLDEFSGSFDKEHRAAATLLIKSLVEQQSFPQILMVSHYLEVYGGMANMDVVALNTSNVVVTHDYNKYVIMQ